MCKIPVAGMWNFQGSENKAGTAEKKINIAGNGAGRSYWTMLLISSYIHSKMLKDFKQGRKSFASI